MRGDVIINTLHIRPGPSHSRVVAGGKMVFVFRRACSLI